MCPWILQAVFPFRARGRVGVMATLMATLIFVGALVIYAYRVRAPDTGDRRQPQHGPLGARLRRLLRQAVDAGGCAVRGGQSAILYRTPQVMDVVVRGKWLTAAGVVVAVGAMALATHWQLVEHAPRGNEVAFLASFRTIFGVAMAYLLLVSVSAHPLGRALARPLSSRGSSRSRSSPTRPIW